VEQVGTGKPCEGEAEESAFCNAQPCAVPCLWSEWLGWSNCTKPCGGGLQVRARVKLQEARFGGPNCTGNASEQQSCNDDLCPVDCKWEDWGAWGACSKSCGKGTKLRARAQKSEEAGGKKCDGKGEETQQCSNPC
jgi:hypothetical protein